MLTNGLTQRSPGFIGAVAGGGCGGGGACGSWVELDRICGSRTCGSVITVSCLPDKQYLKVIYESTACGSDFYTSDLRFNGDGGTSYAWRTSRNGLGDATSGAGSCFIVADNGGCLGDKFGIVYIWNCSTQEKVTIGHNVQRLGTGPAVLTARMEAVSKWINTCSAIDSISLLNRGSGTSASAEMVVLGWDSCDSHTTGCNFWTQLASVDLSGGAASELEANIAARKYLWVQAYYCADGTVEPALAFNDARGTAYNRRYMFNGGTETTLTSTDSILAGSAAPTTPGFINAFIVNISSREKLIMGDEINQNTTGVGNVPSRTEFAGKWTDTSCSITKVELIDDGGSGNLGTSTRMIIWGSN